MVRRDSALILKTIHELRGEEFFVDRYQRGYKWEKQQVEALLNDIHEFVPKGDRFYCLQPVVVKYHPPDALHEKSRWELIDGQQRITTIFLILHFLDGAPHFEIDYRTREASAEFLKRHLDKTIGAADWPEFIKANPGHDNIDIYHFFGACQTIQTWFKGWSEADLEKWKTKLLNHTKVIWYVAEAQEGIDPAQASINVFMRLNSGKIPLTNAELIKATVLHFAAPVESLQRTFRQDAIVREWDQMEHTLQNDAFYRFLCPDLRRDGAGAAKRFTVLLLRKNPARGHELCPCGSGRRLRYCHLSLYNEVRSSLSDEVRELYRNYLMII